MPRILRISDAASLAMHTAVLLAAHPEAPLSVVQIARFLGASEAHLSKVLQQLARGGIVRSARGPRGGFSLNRPPQTLSLLDVYQAIEGAEPFPDCLLGEPLADPRNCIMGGLIKQINRQVNEYFAKARLCDLVRVYDGMPI